MEFSPEELDRLESRLDVLYRLKKKYGSTVDEMLEYLERLPPGAGLKFRTPTTPWSVWRSSCPRARSRRPEGGARPFPPPERRRPRPFSTGCRRSCASWICPRCAFRRSFGRRPERTAWTPDGLDQVQFLMSANVGEALRPIQKVASGGELARIMLALKNVLAEDDGIGSLVFDEVDTGVSGRAAQKVAEKMADVARHKQVLCVTHLPQIAAMADTHFSVEKGEREGRTFTQVERLDRKGRESELARLIGGAEVTPALLRSAQELLDRAEEYRSGAAAG